MFLNGYTKKRDTAHFEFDSSIYKIYFMKLEKKHRGKMTKRNF